MGVAADTGEVGNIAPCSGDARVDGGFLEMVLLELWCFEQTRTFQDVEFLLTAHEGIESRLEALAKGAAERARATMEYFIF